MVALLLNLYLWSPFYLTYTYERNRRADLKHPLDSIMEFNDDSFALDYIRKRGYASYSSIKNVRDCEIPGSSISKNYHVFGKELHSRFLENTKLEKLPKDEEAKLTAMLLSLNSNPIVNKIMLNTQREVRFHQELKGVMVLGYIDILGEHVADLKTTRHSTMAAFALDQDFLQAAMYMAVTNKKDFYYIVISKEKPYKSMVFNVRQYPVRLLLAQQELNRLLKHIKKKL